MKIKKIIGIISVICLLLNMSVVYAGQHQINYVKTLTDDGYLNINGTVQNGANREVFVRVDYPDVTIGETENLENFVIAQRQTRTDANGAFTVSVKLNQIGDRPYTLRIGVLGDDSDVSEEFTFYGSEYYAPTLEAIREAQEDNDADALVNVILTDYDRLYLNTPIFQEYMNEDPDLSGIKSALIQCPVITNISDLEEALESVVIMKDIKDSGNYTGMDAVLGDYELKLEIKASTIYSTTYTNLSTNLKKAVYESFSNKNCFSTDEIKDAFTLSVLNTYLANAIGSSSVKKVLTDNALIFGIDMSEYDISDKDYLKLIGYKFNAVSDVKEKLDDLNEGGSSGGGGGGSGGGGGGGSDKGDITITPAPSQNVVTENVISQSYPFDDMESYVWAKDATLALYESGVINGIGDRSFAPEKVITREEFIKLIISGFDITANENEDASFSDVDKTQWYYPFVKIGVNSGITSGMDNNMFGVGSQITRQDLVVMIYRALEKNIDMPNEYGISAFEDFETISDYAKNAVSFAETNGIVKGMGDGNFHPKNSATRAEAAVIIYNAIQYLAKNK